MGAYPFAAGEVIDGFRLEAPLDPGGMANFWRVSRADIDMPMVMKVPLLRRGEDPITIMMNAARFLNSVAAAYAPRAGPNSSSAEIAAAVRAVPRDELNFMRKFLMDAATIAHKAAEFGYAKLARIDYVGDVPSTQSVENKMLFVLNIDGGERPGRPVNGHGGGNGRNIDGRATIEHDAD